MQLSVPQRRFHRTRRAEIFTRLSHRVYKPVYHKGCVVIENDGDDDDGGGQYAGPIYTRPFGWANAQEGHQEFDNFDDNNSNEN